ncbi:hypothetical protein Bca101_018949 [Brassica carinata]
MRVFVDTKFGETFTFELSHINKLSDIKKRIESSHGIPVSVQKLFFNDVELLVDHYQLAAYRIRKNSRLLLEVRGDHVNNQMLQQSPHAIQGFVPSTATSNYDQVPPPHASASFFNQDPRTMARSNQVPPSHASEAFFNQDRHVNNDGQVLHQPEVSVLESFSMDEFLERVPEPWGRSNYDQVPPSHASESFSNQYRLVSNDGLFPEMPQDISLKQGFWPGTTFGDNFKIQESLRINKKSQDLPSLPSNTSGDFTNENHMFPPDQSSTFGDFLFGDYRHILTDNVQRNWPASTSDEIINKNQVFQTEHSPVQSNLTQESSNQVFQTVKSPPPQRLTLIMTQYDKPGRKFLLEVNATDNVEELKKELEYLLDLPAKGYFLLHKDRVLDDDKSFSINRVANGDTVEIFPGPVIEDYHT